MTETFLFDTYALIEVIKGSKNYEKYIDCKMLINEFIFAELCYKLFRETHENANFYLDKYSPFIFEITPDIIKEAMRFRVKNKKKKLSMTDCISYVMAGTYNIKFLTGNKEFEDLENVEFVK
mgnify:CR=1 FL=1